MNGGWLLQTVILVTGILGQLVVARRRAWGFYAWIVCNVGLIYTGISSHPIPYGNVALYVFYTTMCFYSIRQWGRLDAQTGKGIYTPDRWVVDTRMPTPNKSI